MFKKQTIRDVALNQKTVLLRSDYNVPLEGVEVHDDFRIQKSLPTLRYLLERQCRVVIISHLGRPKGRRDESYSLRPVAQRLADLLQQKIRFVDDCIGDKVYQTIKSADLGSITMLENLRFHEEEKANDEEFAEKIAKSSQADYFIQDGFGAVHRAHASTDAITHYLPSVAGLLVEKEFQALTAAVEQPKRPLVTILGGAKVSDKIVTLKQFIEKADSILIGGAMANTFLASRGKYLGSSLVEPEQESAIDEIYQLVRQKVGEDNVENFLRIPSDLAVGYSLDRDEKRRIVSTDQLTSSDNALDVGPETANWYKQAIMGAGTIIWNGPVGYTEIPAFRDSSVELARAITSSQATSIIGGGDTADFVRSWDEDKSQQFSHISTGGGASLELLSGEKLPGVEALMDAR